MFQGETHFLPALLYNDLKPLVHLKSDEFNGIYESIMSEVPITDAQAISCILQLFSFHKTYASTNFTDKGQIDDPYVIFKITKESCH